MAHTVGQDQFVVDEIRRRAVVSPEEVIDLGDPARVQGGFPNRIFGALRRPAGILVLAQLVVKGVENFALAEIPSLQNGVSGAPAERRMNGRR